MHLAAQVYENQYCTDPPSLQHPHIDLISQQALVVFTLCYRNHAWRSLGLLACIHLLCQVHENNRREQPCGLDNDPCSKIEIQQSEPIA